MPKCPFCAEPVPLATAHILAADIVLRRTNEFLLAVLPVLIEADPEERLMKFVKPLQDAIDTYTEIRLGCATRVDVSAGNKWLDDKMAEAAEIDAERTLAASIGPNRLDQKMAEWLDHRLAGGAGGDGRAVQVPIARTVAAPCICVFKDGERYQHGHCFGFHKERAVGYVRDPVTLEVTRHHPLGDSPPAPITERSVNRG